jgi:hypothetical protein
MIAFVNGTVLAIVQTFAWQTTTVANAIAALFATNYYLCLMEKIATLKKEVKLLMTSSQTSVCPYPEAEDILQETAVTFEDNQTLDVKGGCDDYGCTCISHEKCCGCFVQ